MKENVDVVKLKKEIDSHRSVNKDWFLDLLDDEKQRSYEKRHLRALLSMLRIVYIAGEQAVIKKAQKELAALREEGDYSVDAFTKTNQLNATILEAEKRIESYRHFFEEPYFARMDALDDKEGYNAYYIGKTGDLNLGIVDWRAPLATRYYQKSQRTFSINEYDYEVILRRAIRVASGELCEFTNESMNVKNFLSKEEIAGRDSANVLDPYLRALIQERKSEESVRDIIETIQEKQFDLITRPEREDFIVQGCAGSGKTMVLLHRLSYLMYNNRELSPSDVLVITPSRSFNSFIDELSQVLELGRVRTYTPDDYFLEVLSRVGVDLTGKIGAAAETEDYLAYLYSEQYPKDIQATLDKIYGEIFGLFTSTESREFSEQMLRACREQKEAYTAIKNASVRLRRTVLGEIKETAEGTLRYTKPFRDFMNNVLQIEDFLSMGLEERTARSQSYFYRQLSLFYRSASVVVKNKDSLIAQTLEDIASFREILEREIKDLRRYKVRYGDREEYTYPERIQAREDLLAESRQIEREVQTIGDACEGFAEFFEVLQGQKNLRELGKCETPLDTVRFFYKATVKNQKRSYGMDKKGLHPSDAYALLTVLCALGEELTPRHSLVFVDEGQDISAAQYQLLKKINERAAFNIYGDLKQNITPWRGIFAWENCLPANVYSLNQNYRNTNQIVQYVGEILDADMQPIGFDGPPVSEISARNVSSFFKDKKGLKAVIALPEHLPMLTRGSYNVVSQTGELSKKKVNLLSVYESKGLEFASVAVYDEGMTQNEKYIAYTRALSELTVIRSVKNK